MYLEVRIPLPLTVDVRHKRKWCGAQHLKGYNWQPILKHGCTRSYSRDAGPSIWIVELGIHIVQLATDSQRQRMRGWRLVVGIPGITHVSVLLLHQLHQRMCICAYALHKQTFSTQVACLCGRVISETSQRYRADGWQSLLWTSV